MAFVGTSICRSGSVIGAAAGMAAVAAEAAGAAARPDPATARIAAAAATLWRSVHFRAWFMFTASSASPAPMGQPDYKERSGSLAGRQAASWKTSASVIR